MKTVACLLLVAILTGSSIMVAARQNQGNQQTLSQDTAAPILTTTTIDAAVYTQVTIPGVDTALANPGAPAVPMKTTVLELPFGTTVTAVSVTPLSLATMTIDHPLAPSPQIIVQDTAPTTPVLNSDIYASAQYYPATWFDYSTGGGLNDQGNHVTYLVIRTFPIRVSPATYTLQYFQKATITVEYSLPTTTQTFGANPNGYELLIITPKTFTATLQPLVQEKISHGINTTIMTLEDIYAKYTGYDKPEQIKYAIKDALENPAWNIKYVLLVGGLKGYMFGNGARENPSVGVKNWYFPVRYTNMDEGGDEHDTGFITDLYYADIYNANGSFSTWDSNGDHVYGTWLDGHAGYDIIDLYPDVAVGRLAARTTSELKIMVNKILTYESKPADPSWFKKIILVGGDTDDDRPDSDINEGELITTVAYNESMASFSPIDLYVSNRNISNDFTPTRTNLERVISQGAGFLFFDGHGNPLSWNTHWHDEFTWARGETPGGLNEYSMMKIHNDDKLNVCIVGGCHNSMINVSVLWTLNPKNPATWCYGEPAPRSWSEWLMAMKHGGSIACIGSSALSYGMDGILNGEPAGYQGLGGFVERTFLQTYNASANKTVGNCWSGSITRYLNVWPGMDQFADAKTVEEWLALGDPSLLIGGYS